METSESIPAVGVSAPDLAELGDRPGPFATIYLSTEGRLENAAQRSEQRWKTMRGELAAAGVPEGVLDEIEPLVSDAHLQGECLAVVADAERVVHMEHGPRPPVRGDVSRWAPLPSLVQILAWRQDSPPYLTVLTDRTGADITLVRRGAEDVHREAGGDEGPISKVAPGGWSQRRYQQRAENTWEQNAEDVAAEITKLVQRSNARAIVLAGDVRALELLKASLAHDLLEMLVEVEGGRSADGSEQQFADRTDEAIHAIVSRDTERLLEKFREELGQRDLGVEGVEATIGALAKAQADVLLVHEAPEDDRTAWFGPAPTQIALREADVSALGVDAPQQGRLVDVLVRAALGTGASVRVVPPVGGPADGVGALLRWSDASPAV